MQINRKCTACEPQEIHKLWVGFAAANSKREYCRRKHLIRRQAASAESLEQIHHSIGPYSWHVGHAKGQRRSPATVTLHNRISPTPRASVHVAAANKQSCGGCGYCMSFEDEAESVNNSMRQGRLRRPTVEMPAHVQK